jgi:hypothetical protein
MLGNKIEREMDKLNGQKGHNKLDKNSIQIAAETEKNIGSHSNTPDAEKESLPKNGILRRIKKTTSTDRITAFATVIIMIATTAYSIIAHKQWKVMERQTDATFQQLSTAKFSIKIADDALKDARESGKEQSEKNERLTKANEEIAKASSKSIETAKQVAKKSLDATIDKLRLEQRAWVGPVELITAEYKEGKTKTCVKEGQGAGGTLLIYLHLVGQVEQK